MIKRARKTTNYDVNQDLHFLAEGEHRQTFYDLLGSDTLARGNSTIPSAGSGIFATEEITKNSVMCEYVGLEIHYDSIDQPHRSMFPLTGEYDTMVYEKKLRLVTLGNRTLYIGPGMNDLQDPSRSNCRLQLRKSRAETLKIFCNESIIISYVTWNGLNRMTQKWIRYFY